MQTFQQGVALLHLHQPLGGEADHFPQRVRACPFLKHRTKGDHLVGHRGHPRIGHDLAA